MGCRGIADRGGHGCCPTLKNDHDGVDFGEDERPNLNPRGLLHSQCALT
jgi:hypothetical protein